MNLGFFGCYRYVWATQISNSSSISSCLGWRLGRWKAFLSFPAPPSALSFPGTLILQNWSLSTLFSPLHWTVTACFVVQSLSRIQLFATPRTSAHQAPLSFTISRSWLRFMSIESVYLTISSSATLLLLLLSVFPSIRVFSSELALCIRWPKYWSFNFSISPFILLKSESVSHSVVSDSLQTHEL